MKKHSLFKIILIVLGLLVVVTYFIAGREGAIAHLPIGDVAINFVQSFYYFFDTFVFVLVVGAFYGVLNKTGAYKKLLDTIVTKVKSRSKEFIFATIIIFALVASLTGLTLPLLIFVPFAISIILLLGYDKLVAISATVVSILVGFIGGIFATFKDPSYGYGYAATTFEELVGIEKFGNILPKILLLVLAIGLLIYFVNRHIKGIESKKVKYDLNDNTDVLIAEVKGSYKNIKTWPLIVILSVVLVLLILGFMPWGTLFGIEVFDNFHTWLTGLKIGEFAIFNSVISTNMPSFGNWMTLGNYMVPVVILIFFTLIIKFTYKIKFDEAIEGFVEGFKKMLPAALLVILAYTVLVCAHNNGFISTIITKTSETGMGLNLVFSSLITMLGSFLHVDLYYTAAGVFTPMVALIENEALLPVLALAFQSLYGLIAIVGPTSLLLIVVLTYLDVPYTTWLKYIWRLVLSLFILIFIILFIVSLI